MPLKRQRRHLRTIAQEVVLDSVQKLVRAVVKENAQVHVPAIALAGVTHLVLLPVRNNAQVFVDRPVPADADPGVGETVPEPVKRLAIMVVKKAAWQDVPMDVLVYAPMDVLARARVVVCILAKRPAATLAADHVKDPVAVVVVMAAWELPVCFSHGCY